MEVCSSRWAYLPCAWWNWWSFGTTSGSRTSSVRRTRRRSSYSKLYTRWRYRAYVAVTVAAASIRLFHVDGLRSRYSTRCDVLRRNFHYYCIICKHEEWFTLVGDWRREILREEGTGFGSEIGRELGRGGLELDGCLLYLETKKKFYLMHVGRLFHNSLFVISLSINIGQVVGH